MAKRVDYKLSEALAMPIISIILCSALVYLLGAVIVSPEVGVLCVIGWFVLTGAMIKKKIDIAKKFTVKEGNKFTIEDVKKEFGTPTNVIKDGDLSYYTFEEQANSDGLFGKVFQTIHTFTADKKGVVIKHEMDL